MKKKILTLLTFLVLLGAISASAFCDGATVFRGGQQFTINQNYYSPNHQYRLIQQSDGNLVLYGRGRALWASGTYGLAVKDSVFQGDGNIVIYGYDKAIWASHTDGNPGATLELQDDGNLVIYLGRKAIWATNTY